MTDDMTPEERERRRRIIAAARAENDAAPRYELSALEKLELKRWRQERAEAEAGDGGLIYKTCARPTASAEARRAPAGAPTWEQYLEARLEAEREGIGRHRQIGRAVRPRLPPRCLIRWQRSSMS